MMKCFRGKNILLLCLLATVFLPQAFGIDHASFDKLPLYGDSACVDLDNPFAQGNFGYRFPVDVPTGINGLEPSLALVYNSELTREKLLGVGWELAGYNRIRRNDRLGVPWYDHRDTFILTLNGKEYVFEEDGTFEEQTSLRVERHGGGWQVYEADGTILEFTSSASCAKGTYSWVLTEQKDTNGNSMTYTYDSSLLAAEGGAYLTSITYMGSLGKAVAVNLLYENTDVANDIQREPSLSYWPGFKEYYSRRLIGIETPDIRYTLVYKDSVSSKRTLLAEIVPSEGKKVCFSYQSDETNTYELWKPSGQYSFAFLSDYLSRDSLYGKRRFMVLSRDFNNDGLPDLLVVRMLFHLVDRMEATIDYLPEIYLNDGQGNWIKGYDFSVNSAVMGQRYIGSEDNRDIFPQLLGENTVKFEKVQEIHPRIYDINNDGYLDVILVARYFYGGTFQYTQPAPNPWTGEVGQVVVGYQDLVSYDERVHYAFINDGTGRFTYKSQSTTPMPYVDQNGDGIVDPTPLFGSTVEPIITDVNGDRFPDFFTRSTYYINNGQGDYQGFQGIFEQSVYFRESGVDLNGDTVPESVGYDVQSGRHVFSDDRYSLSLYGNYKYCLSSLSYINGALYELFVDVNNDGMKDFLTMDGAYINQTKPDLLCSISGDESVSVTYQRVPVSTQHGDDTNRRGPTIYRWAVSSIISDDSSTGFAYTGGLHDLLRREFRGFEQITVTDEDGSTTYTYDPSDRRKMGLVKSVAGVDGRVSYDYGITGNNESWRIDTLTTNSIPTHGPTSVVTNKYDSDGNLTRQESRLEDGGFSASRVRIYEYSKDSAKHVVSTIKRSAEQDETGRTLQENLYYYDEQNQGYVDKGNLTRIDSLVHPRDTGSADLTVRIGYDGRGVANSVMDGQGNVSATTELLRLDDKYMKRITRNALGHESYELIEIASGLTVESVDANKAKTSYAYYPDKRLRRVTRPDGVFTEYEYIEDENGTTNITRSQEEAGGSVLLWHEEQSNKKGELIATVDKRVRANGANGAGPFELLDRPVRTAKTYDRRGQVQTESLPYFEGDTPRWVSYLYESTAKHRLLKVTYPDGTYTSYEYDDPNRRVTVIDPAGNRTETSEYYESVYIEGAGNAVCRVAKTINAQNGVTRAYYSLDGNLLKEVDANGREKVYAYDSLGRVYKSKDPYKGQVSYVYGSNGQLTARTDAKGQVLKYEYDILNRLTAKVFPDGRKIQWLYDLTDGSHGYGIGRLGGYTDRSGVTNLGYDALGNLRLKEQGSRRLSFTYDGQDRVRSLTYPDGKKVEYRYDLLGLAEVTQEGRVLSRFSNRTAFGAAQELQYANGICNRFSFNQDNGQLQSIQVSGAYQPLESGDGSGMQTQSATLVGGGVLLNLGYQYDRVGNVMSIMDQTPFTSHHPAAISESYVYDAINRLTAASGPYGSLIYQYDPVGNILVKEGISFTYGDPEHPYAPTFGSNGITAGYDANGNMVTKKDAFGNEYDLIYDEENQLVRVWKNDSYSEEYTYDATGYRVARQVGSTRTDYVYWGNTLLYEITGGKTIRYIWAEGKLIAKVEEAGTTWFSHDHLGSSKLQTDDTGQVISTDVTRPFGPRVCDEILKEDFASNIQIDLKKSTITYDQRTGTVKAPAKGKAQDNLLGNNNTIAIMAADYTPVKSIQFKLTEQDKARKAGIKFTLTGRGRIRVVGEDGQEYFVEEYATKTEKIYSATVNLTKAPNQAYTVTLELASHGEPVLMATNQVFEVTWGDLGLRLGELYMLPYNLTQEVRSLRLTWAGQGVAFQVSTDNGKTWESITNGQATNLRNPGRSLLVRGLLTIDDTTVLDGYHLEVNPAKYSLFTGKTLEESTGLVYFGGRWYDPEFGRFITVDPAEDGENWYEFCNSNPIMYADPDGEAPFLIGVAFTAAFYFIVTNEPDDTPIELLGNAVDAIIFSATCSIGGGGAVISISKVTTGKFLGSVARQQISYGNVDYGAAAIEGGTAGVFSAFGLAFGRAREFVKFKIHGVRPLRRVLKPHQLKRFRVLKQLHPEYMNGIAENSYVRPLTPKEVRAVRKKVRVRGHHQHPISLGGKPNPPSQYITPTDETRFIKNPIHTEVTNFWSEVLRDLRKGNGI